MGRHPTSPTCSECGAQMLLVKIFPDRPGYEQRTYKCPWCPHRMTDVSCVNELTTRLMAKQHFDDWGKSRRD
jgi:DNA-directed RNA polymerase subunit RPC12/RpoP